MARCWTCGSSVEGWNYHCSTCRNIKQIKTLEQLAGNVGQDISNNLVEINNALEGFFSDISHELSSGFEKVATVFEWGFSEINWSLHQISDVMMSIDNTLKNPSLTQANEWRKMAEELRNRGALIKSEEFFSKSIERNPLDYRTYIGLAMSYLRMNEFEKARLILEESLPHAPRDKIDYKSYSYRLIGHIYACSEDYQKAKSILSLSIDLSPKYANGYYDHAQYCAQTKEKDLCLSSLNTAISLEPKIWYLAKKEDSFDLLRNEVDGAILEILASSQNKIKNLTIDIKNELKKIKESFELNFNETENMAERGWALFNKLKLHNEFAPSTDLMNLKIEFNQEFSNKMKENDNYLDKSKENDYFSILKTFLNAIDLYNNVKMWQNSLEQNIIRIKNNTKSIVEVFEYKLKVNKKDAIPTNIVAIPLLSGSVGAVILGITYDLSNKASLQGALFGFIIGLAIGLIIGIYKQNKNFNL